MEWQPIETAPKDGTSILIAEAGCRHVMQAMWNAWDYPGHPYWCCGRQGAKSYDDTGSMQPTHWRPLPSPPK